MTSPPAGSHHGGQNWLPSIQNVTVLVQLGDRVYLREENRFGWRGYMAPHANQLVAVLHRGQWYRLLEHPEMRYATPFPCVIGGREPGFVTSGSEAGLQ